MFTFLRRIRQKLIASGSVTKYLLYATGEILLVVIGILIALQIGNLNQDLQNKELLRVSLENLREDLELQREIIDGQITFETEMIARADSALQLMRDPEPPVTELAPLLRNLGSRRTFTANKATFNNLEATGNIVLIEDKELKNELIRYYQQLDYTTAVINNNNLFLIDNIYGDFVRNNRMEFHSNNDGSVRLGHSITSLLRFTIIEQLDGRRRASESLLNITALQLDSTLKLINLLNEILGDRALLSENGSSADV